MLDVQLTAIVCVGYNAIMRMCIACITERVMKCKDLSARLTKWNSNTTELCHI